MNRKERDADVAEALSVLTPYLSADPGLMSALIEVAAGARNSAYGAIALHPDCPRATLARLFHGSYVVADVERRTDISRLWLLSRTSEPGCLPETADVSPREWRAGRL